jgi:hypothetical protein
MSSIIKVDTIQNQSGANIISESSNTITVGASGDTVTVPSGATFNINGTGITSNGITMADQWRLSASTNDGINGDVTSNWERVDNTGWGGIGTGLTESSGIFSFPSTGIYNIIFTAAFKIQSGDNTVDLGLNITNDNSSYSEVSVSRAGSSGGGTAHNITSSNAFLFDVTNTSNNKFKFVTGSFAGSGSFLRGDTAKSFTGFTVIKLGDT